MQISIVIPAYNEEAVIASIIEELLQLEIQTLHEIIVVDDGSKDKTVDVVKSIQDPRVKVQQHPYNIGNGAAVKTGIRAAEGDVIIMMDSDGQHPPSEIPEMLPHIEKYAMVVGARNKKSVSAWHRDVANKIFNAYASYLIGHQIPDLTSGFRIIRAHIVKNFLYLLPNGYSYPTTITVSLFRSGYPVKYHEFASPARVGVSKINPIRDGLRFLLILTRLGVFFVPLKLFLPLSAMLFIPGIFYTGFRIIFEQRFSGLGGLATTLGFLVLLLGLIAEQIATLRYVNVHNE